MAITTMEYSEDHGIVIRVRPSDTLTDPDPVTRGRMALTTALSVPNSLFHTSHLHKVPDHLCSSAVTPARPAPIGAVIHRVLLRCHLRRRHRHKLWPGHTTHNVGRRVISVRVIVRVGLSFSALRGVSSGPGVSPSPPWTFTHPPQGLLNVDASLRLAAEEYDQPRHPLTLKLCRWMAYCNWAHSL